MKTTNVIFPVKTVHNLEGKYHEGIKRHFLQFLYFKTWRTEEAALFIIYNWKHLLFGDHLLSLVFLQFYFSEKFQSDIQTENQIPAFQSIALPYGVP